MIGRTEKSMTFFAYRKHNAIYFRVIVHPSQKTFHEGRQNLVNTEISVTDLQQVHRQEERLLIDNNFDALSFAILRVFVKANRFAYH